MRRRRLYIVLLVLLFVCIAAKNQSLFTREQVKKGKEPGTFNGGWYSLISKEVNDKRIKLKIDGRKVKAKKASVIMTDEGEFMVPVSFLPDYFSCAARIYDNSRLVMERNTIYAEMKEGEQSPNSQERNRLFTEMVNSMKEEPKLKQLLPFLHIRHSWSQRTDRSLLQDR